jgi:AhpD family alkylhydroperoxidase
VFLHNRRFTPPVRVLLEQTLLPGREAAILALGIAQENECQYCLSAYSALSEVVGLNTIDALGVTPAAEIV